MDPYHGPPHKSLILLATLVFSGCSYSQACLDYDGICNPWLLPLLFGRTGPTAMLVVGHSTTQTAGMIRKFSLSGEEDLNWRKDLDGAGVDAIFYSVREAPDGAVYVAGGQQVGGADWSTWIKKFSSAGAEILTGWDKTSNATVNNDWWDTILTDSVGAVYVAGREDVNTGVGDGRIRKYSSDGTEVIAGWSKLISSGAGRDGLDGMCIDGSQNIFAVLGRNNHTNPTATDNAWWIKKYDQGGTEDANWDEIIPHPGGNNGWSNQPYACAATRTGEIVVVGTMQHTAGINDDFAHRVYRLNAAPAVQWTDETNVRTGLAFDLEIAETVTVASDGSTFVAGALHPAAGVTNLNWMIRRFDASGAVVWSQSFDGPVAGEDRVFAVALDETRGHLYVGGRWNTASGQRGHIKRLYLDGQTDATWPSIVVDGDVREILLVAD